MRVLLTGYNGFIGKNIHKELSEMNNVSDIFLLEKDDVMKHINNKKLLEDIVKNTDVILHNGAISSTDNENYKEIMPYNVFFSKILIEIALLYKKKIIFASSASIYGNGDNYPQNLYAWSKLITEDYGRSIYPEGFTSLRYFNVYGPYEEHKGKMSSIGYQAWLSKLKSNDVFLIFPKKPKRDFVYVKDVVSSNISAIYAPSGVYDVGSGQANTFEDFLSNMEIEFEYTDQKLIPTWYQFFTKSDSSKWIPNWTPKYDLKSGCEDYLKYLKEYGTQN